MGTNLNKYFAGELTSEEKEVFLLNVKNNGEMREEFIEYQSVVLLWIGRSLKMIKNLLSKNYLNL